MARYKISPVNRKKLTLPFFTVALLLLPYNYALSASDGSLGDTSTGNIGVNLNLPPLFRISGISDLDFGKYSGHGDISLDDDVCVWTNTASGNYRVTAKGQGTNYAFVVVKQGDATQTIPYSVRWNNTSGVQGNIELTANVISADKTGANHVSTTCASGSAVTANFQITFTQSSLLAVRAGTYTGVLTLVISAPTS